MYLNCIFKPVWNDNPLWFVVHSTTIHFKTKRPLSSAGAVELCWRPVTMAQRWHGERRLFVPNCYSCYRVSFSSFFSACVCMCVYIYIHIVNSTWAYVHWGKLTIYIYIYMGGQRVAWNEWYEPGAKMLCQWYTSKEYQKGSEGHIGL